MDHKAISITRLAATALLVCVAAIACARHDGAPATDDGTPAAQWTETDLPAPTPTPSATGPASSQTAGPTTDQAVDLSDIDDLLKAINDALSGANAGPSGGE